MKLPGNLSLKATSMKYVSTGVAALGLLAFSVQAEAADIYAPIAPAPFPVAAPLAPLWSGLYGGAHIGGAWADLSTHDLDDYWYGAVPYSIRNVRNYGVWHTDQSPSGVFGGGTIGYNMQRGGVVFGIEADFGDMGLSGSKFIGAPAVIPPNHNPPYLLPSAYQTAKAHISTGFYGDVTGRLGWAWGPWLFYGKGGLAVLDAKINVSDSGADYSGYGTNDSSHIGWTAGGGVEYLWNPAWSVKVEYQFFDFGTSSSALNTYTTDGSLVNYGNFNHDLEINTVKVGINYHLGCCDSALPPPLK
jgi:outer membrane immunogenic protein